MSFLELPPEILIKIFDTVGAANLRSDLSRVTVSRQWNKYAHTACFQDLCITQQTLRGLVSSPCLQADAHPFTDIVRSISLNLIGFDDWSLLDLETYWYPRLPWEAKLKEDLDFFATMTQTSPKLRSIRIRATEEPCMSCPGPPRQDYLYLSTMRILLSANNLSNLDLDLCGTRLITSRNHQHVGGLESHIDRGTHICPNIAAHLTNLRTLRLRMRNICPDVIKPQTGSTKLRLEKVLINLSLDDESPGGTSNSFARRCGSVPGPFVPGDFLQLRADMEKHAQVLANQMAAPKIVRVLTHTFPYRQLNAFDALTGQTFKLSHDARVHRDWDADEETIEDEPESEAEVETDDLSDFCFDGDNDEIVIREPESDEGEVSDFWDFASDGDDE
jgi:hypothetical protein